MDERVDAVDVGWHMHEMYSVCDASNHGRANIHLNSVTHLVPAVAPQLETQHCARPRSRLLRTLQTPFHPLKTRRGHRYREHERFTRARTER